MVRTSQLLELLNAQGVLFMKNGSADLHFDDEGLIQEIHFKKRRRKRDGERLQVIPVKRGNVTASFSPDGEIGSLTVETKWIRKFAHNL